jgi:hypothetical protein
VKLELIKKNLEKAGVQFEKGLSDSEVQQIENVYSFRFPPDLRQFLQFALPVGNHWLDWRNDSKNKILEGFNWVYEGIYFDIEHNSFWLEEWGEKPSKLSEMCEIAKLNIQKAPKLIPVFSHRYIPETPNLAGNPILSVYQTDIIIYGSNLQIYFQEEFGYYFDKNERLENIEPRKIEFWTKLVEQNQ